MPDLRQIPSYSGVDDTLGTWLGAARVGFVLVLAALAGTIIYLAATVWIQLRDVPEIPSIAAYDRGDPIQIFDRYDRPVYSYKGDSNRRRLTIDQVAPAARLAVIAAEDHKFYEHQGIDPVGMCRAFVTNLRAGKVVEGGSTITQQLVKNIFFESPRRTIERKLAEAVIALEVEKQYSKDQILEMYLNEAYFGSGAYGIEQASRYYFNKPASLLDLAEAAFLAGVIKSPSRLGSKEHRGEALAEQKEVLAKMHRYGIISSADYSAALRRFLFFTERAEIPEMEPIKKYPFFISYVIDLIKQRFTPSEMYRHGLRVYTTLDPTAQEIAEQALSEGINAAPEGVTQGGLATVSVRDGSLVALVGGVKSFERSQFNCATHPHTAGSAFKPFVYMAALDKGIVTAESFIDDTPLVMNVEGGRQWKPQNFDKSYMGQITVRDALVFSRNVPAVRLAMQVGIPSVIDSARRAGIWQELPANPSLALGSAAVSPLEMAGAYSTFARDGLVIKPWVLRRIENKRGRLIQKYDQPVSRAFDPHAAAALVDILHEVVTRGTGVRANLPNCFVAGKTGTADQAKDLWFVGFTPDLSTAVWGGNDDNLPIPGTHTTGGTVMAGIWRDYNERLYNTKALVRSGLIRTLIKSPPPPRPVPRPPAVHPPSPLVRSQPPAQPRAPRTASAASQPASRSQKAQAGQLSQQKARMDYSYTTPADLYTPPEDRARRLQF